VSDITVPSWRPRRERSAPPWRMLAVAGGLCGVVTLGGAVAWGISRMGPHPVPVIEPDSRPLKIRPENPGGLVVPNQDQLVLLSPAVRRAVERSQEANARLDEGPEMPALDQLRREAAPPGAPISLLPPVAGSAPSAPATPATPAPQPVSMAPPVAPQPAPAEPPAPAPIPTIQPVAHGRAQVQLGALPSEEAARGEWERLIRRVPELAAFQPRITRLEREGQAPLFRLRTGGLADSAAAHALCEAVRGKGGNCMPIGS